MVGEMGNHHEANVMTEGDEERDGIDENMLIPSVTSLWRFQVSGGM